MRLGPKIGHRVLLLLLSLLLVVVVVAVAVTIAVTVAVVEASELTAQGINGFVQSWPKRLTFSLIMKTSV